MRIGGTPSTSGPSTLAVRLDLPVPLSPTTAARSKRRHASSSVCSMWVAASTSWLAQILADGERVDGVGLLKAGE